MSGLLSGPSLNSPAPVARPGRSLGPCLHEAEQAGPLSSEAGLLLTAHGDACRDGCGDVEMHMGAPGKGLDRNKGLEISHGKAEHRTVTTWTFNYVLGKSERRQGQSEQYTHGVLVSRTSVSQGYL